MFDLALIFILLLMSVFLLNIRNTSLFSTFLTSLALIIYLSYSSYRIGGIDTPNYRHAFASSSCSTYEVGFRFICSLSGSEPFSVIFFGSSLLALLMIWTLSNDKRTFIFSIFFLTPYYLIPVDMGYLRQSIATSLLYLSLFGRAKLNRALIILPPLFHYSSLATAAVLCLRGSKINGYIISGLVCLLIPLTCYYIDRFIDYGIIELLFVDLSIPSILQLGLLLVIARVSLPHSSSNTYFSVMIYAITVLSIFGHAYRFYLSFLPLLALGLSRYYFNQAISRRIIIILLLSPILALKLYLTVRDYPGAFLIPYDENSILIPLISD